MHPLIYSQLSEGYTMKDNRDPQELGEAYVNARKLHPEMSTCELFDKIVMPDDGERLRRMDMFIQTDLAIIAESYVV